MDILKAGPVSAGGGFEFSRAELATHLAEWETLRVELDEDAKSAHELAQTPASGREIASENVANHLRRTGAEFLRHNKAMITFVDGHIAALRAARQSYAVSDENARHGLGRHR